MNSMPDVLIASCRPLPSADVDEPLLVEALARQGLRAASAPWDDPATDWSRARACVLRSTWDYHRRLNDFLAWAERTEAVTRLCNPAAVIRWNAHKGYLRALEARGVPVVPTLWLERGTTPRLTERLAGRSWGEVVVKPAVSLGAHDTLRVHTREFARADAHAAHVLATRDVMVQPYLASVEAYGERSLIFIDGQLSHAIRKKPALAPEENPSGDPLDGYRRVEPAEDELSIARRILHILQASEFEPLYARVDLARDERGAPLLMELELIEPFLFLFLCPEAAERLARAIALRVRA